LDGMTVEHLGVTLSMYRVYFYVYLLLQLLYTIVYMFYSSFFFLSLFHFCVFFSFQKKDRERGEGWKCFPCVRACPADHATDTLESVSRRIPLASLTGHFHFLWVLSSPPKGFRRNRHRARDSDEVERTRFYSFCSSLVCRDANEL
jgi:hypothetical protein